MNQDATDFNFFLVSTLLRNTIFIASLNSFLYSWHFIEALEINQSDACKEKAYRILRKVSILLVPLLNIVFFVVLIVYRAKYFWSLKNK